MLKRLFENFVLKATDWWFRVTSIERFLLTSAFGLLIAVFAGPPLILTLIRLFFDAIPEGVVRAQEVIAAIDIWLLGICSFVIMVALALAIARFRGEAQRNSKKRLLVVEGRGLRDDDGSPLVDVAKSKHPGMPASILLDLRNRLDGKVIEPARALDEIAAVHRSVKQHKDGADSSDVHLVYGGLTSVPYTFLTGVLLDDEGAISIYDWDRTREDWRNLDCTDDGLSFLVTDIEALETLEEVVLAVAFSYPISAEDLASTFSVPVVNMTLNGLSSDAHWSQSKQNRLAQEFLETLKLLGAKGAKRVHLILAAPNSVVFTFGRRYDKRNLPEIVVYQYERGQNPSYPWGVKMPVAGVEKAEIVVTQ